MDLVVVSFSEILYGVGFQPSTLRNHRLHSCLYFFDNKGNFHTGIEEFSDNFRFSKRIPDSFYSMFDQFYPMNQKLIKVIPRYLKKHTFKND